MFSTIFRVIGFKGVAIVIGLIVTAISLVGSFWYMDIKQTERLKVEREHLTDLILEQISDREKREVGIKVDQLVLEEMLENQRKLQSEYTNTVDDLLSRVADIRRGEAVDGIIKNKEESNVSEEDELRRTIHERTILHSGMFDAYCRAVSSSKGNDPSCPQ